MRKGFKSKNPDFYLKNVRFIDGMEHKGKIGIFVSVTGIHKKHGAICNIWINGTIHDFIVGLDMFEFTDKDVQAMWQIKKNSLEVDYKEDQSVWKNLKQKIQSFI